MLIWLGRATLSLLTLCTVCVSFDGVAGAKESRSPRRSNTARPTRARVAGAYAGFDKNLYPGDDVLAELRRNFAFSGYWLNAPPGMKANTWSGKRILVHSLGFGFAILFNGRSYSDLKGKDAAALGRSEAADAIAAAGREGFPAGAIIFLDQEEGGQLLPEQATYLFSWIDRVERSAFRPGVYGSGIADGQPNGAKTVEEISSHFADRPAARRPAIWVANDGCPPAPGCALPVAPGRPRGSGFADAAIWQYAQSPRRPEFTAGCAVTYASDGACYAPGMPHTGGTAIDLNTADSADPSHGR